MSSLIKRVKRAVDPQDADRKKKSVDKIKEQIEAYAKRKKKAKEEPETMEDKLFGNEEI